MEISFFIIFMLHVCVSVSLILLVVDTLFMLAITYNDTAPKRLQKDVPKAYNQVHILENGY